MKTRHKCSLAGTLKREEIEQACCLHALGELPIEESSCWKEHLRICESCRELTMDCQQIMLLDLPAVAIAESMAIVTEQIAEIDGLQMLANIRERISGSQTREREQAAGRKLPIAIASKQHRLFGPWQITASIGWAVAATLFVALLAGMAVRPVPQTFTASALEHMAPAPNAAALEDRVAEAEGQVRRLQDRLMQAKTKVRITKTDYSRLSAESQDLAAANSALEARLKDTQGNLAQESAELELTRQSMADQIAAQENVRLSLYAVEDQLEKEKNEVARLESVAVSTPAHFPVSDEPLGDSEAREILGARDLHIVDVYDVDDSGKPSRAYGRVYFVNHSELIFYAFDLSKLEKGHKVVAFQAWGFRQPQSSKVESLGLFYLENATLNRWTLRVSDPQIISRIDSLFVTIEPPGGSRFPKGKRLLIASLAGPPNHP